MHDYSDFQTGASGDLLTQISIAADNLSIAQRKVAAAEKALSDATLELKHYAETVLPELMEKAGQTSITTANGHRLEIKEDIRANLAKDRVEKGVDWLRENGHDSVVKTEVATVFSAGHDTEARALAERLRGINHATIQFRHGVHPSTLSSLVRELLADGVDVPQDLFGVYRQKVAKLK